MKRLMTLILLVTATGGIVVMSGCENDAGNTALLGAAIGTGVGALAGGDTEGALIGGAIGTGAGYMIGNESDKKKTEARTDAKIAEVQAAQNVETIWITNSNGSQVSVKVRKESNGPGYFGPRGERYASRPTEEQLRPVYGF